MFPSWRYISKRTCLRLVSRWLLVMRCCMHGVTFADLLHGVVLPAGRVPRVLDRCKCSGFGKMDLFSRVNIPTVCIDNSPMYTDCCSRLSTAMIWPMGTAACLPLPAPTRVSLPPLSHRSLCPSMAMFAHDFTVIRVCCLLYVAPLTWLGPIKTGRAVCGWLLVLRQHYGHIDFDDASVKRTAFSCNIRRARTALAQPVILSKP